MTSERFVWSAARHAVFRACLRRYYYEYYADPTNYLRRLRTRWAWTRKRLREAAQDYLEGNVGVEEATRALLERLRSDFVSSRRHQYRTDPQVEGLIEHEYGLTVPDAEWKSLAESVVEALRLFSQSEYGRLLRESASGRTIHRAPETYEYRGLTIEARPVLSLCTPLGITVHDWPEPEVEAPLARAALAAWAHAKWRVPPERITVVEYTLPTGPLTDTTFGADKLDAGLELIFDSADEMRYPLADPDRNVARESDFDFTEDARRCQICPFLGICPRWR